MAEKKFNEDLCEQVRQGKLAIENTDAEKLKTVIAYIFPESIEPLAKKKVYQVCNSRYHVWIAIGETNLPTRPVQDFFVPVSTPQEQGRGQLTERIKEASVKLLGYEISVPELRLMPYIQNIMVNNQKLDPNKINSVERGIISDWKNKGYVDGGMTGFRITKEFWDIINEIIFLGYVDLT